MKSSNCCVLFVLTISVQICTSILNVYIYSVYIVHIYIKIEKNRVNNLNAIGLNFLTFWKS